MFFFTLNAFPAICSKPCKILESVKGKKDPGTGLSLKNLRNFQAHLLLLQNGDRHDMHETTSYKTFVKPRT